MKDPTVFPGQGGTYVIGTDRHAVTVCRVEAGRIGVRFDRVRGRGIFNPADTSLEPERWFKMDRGVFRLEGRRFGHLELGRRESYRDPALTADFGI